MNVADLLSYADIKQLNRIASHYDCICNTNSKRELIQAILGHVQRKADIRQTLETLQAEELVFLHALLFERRGSFSLEDLVAKARQGKRQLEEVAVNPRDMISKFMQRGWLFNGYRHHDRYLFHIPVDLKRRFSEQFMLRLEEQMVYSPTTESVRNEAGLLSSDVPRFLAQIAQRARTLNPQGYLYKRELNDLLAEMSIVEVLPKEAWRFGFGRRYKEYPARFSLIYDYCFYHKWIQEDEDVLRLTDAGASVHQAPTADELYRFWLKLYKGPISNLPILARWIVHLSAERWVTTDSLSKALLPFVQPYYYETPESIVEKRVMQMMVHLGILVQGTSEEQTVVRATVTGQQIVEGTFVEEHDTIRMQE